MIKGAISRVGFLVAVCLLGGLAGSVSSARACDAEAQHAFGVIPGCFDQRIADAPTATNLAPDFTQAGGHPYEITVRLNVNAPAEENPINGAHWPPEPLKDIFIRMPQGLVANPTAVATCTMLQLESGDPENGSFEILENAPLCPPASQIGVAAVDLSLFEEVASLSKVPLYYMGSPPGTVARFGFNVLGVTAIVDAEVGPGYEIMLKIKSLNQGFAFDGAGVTLWGSPADSSHIAERACPGKPSPAFSEEAKTCPAGIPVRSFLRLPTSCTGPTVTSLQVDSWSHPGEFKEVSVTNHLAPGIFGDPTEVSNYPAKYPGMSAAEWGPPQGFMGCNELPFSPSITVQPTTHQAGAPTGLDIDLTFPQQGLSDPAAVSEADLKSAAITLPKEISLNPSVANGLTACTAAQAHLYSNEAASCPDSSKLGQIQIYSPLLEGPISGSIEMAAAGTSSSVIELPVYLIAESENLVIKLSARVVLDEASGELTAVLDEGPQLPVDRLRLHFFDGERAPFVNPATCGTYESRGRFTSWSRSEPVEAAATFDVTSGPLGSQCSSGGTGAAFRPRFRRRGDEPHRGCFQCFHHEVQPQ